MNGPSVPPNYPCSESPEASFRLQGESAKQLAEQWLSAEANRIWLVAERCLRQYQRAQLRPQPSDSALAEIEGILSARRMSRGGRNTGPMDEAELDQAIHKAEAAVGPLRKAAPFGRIAQNLGLSPLECEVLIVSIAPHVDPPLGDLFNLLRGSSSSRRGVDLALIAQIYQLERADRLALLGSINPERPLCRWRMIQVLPADSTESYSSMNYRSIMPTFELLSVIAGQCQLSPTLFRAGEIVHAEPTLDDLIFDEEFHARIRPLCQAAEQARTKGLFSIMPWLVLWGPRGIGKRELARRIAAYAGRPLLSIDHTAHEITGYDSYFSTVQREALLRGAGLYIGRLGTEDQYVPELEVVRRRIVDYPSFVVLGFDTMSPPRLKLERSLIEVEMPLPSEPTRLRLWERSLPVSVRGPDVRLDSLARAFRLTPGEILETAAEATQRAQLDQLGTVKHEVLRHGVDRRLRNELGDMARRISVSADWSDLVLPAEDIERIREFIGRSKHATRVFGDWGFGQRIGYGKGLIALFSGPPGTGKTMLAGLIAKELDLDVYQVDLSKVISKWVGETEKQLSKLFDQAERAHAVLLFDEADSLFAKRTDVKGANDRYANLATNYLLQRLEHYSGVVVMSTNKEAALDEALQRRLTLHLRLQKPEPPERERLWRSMLPRKAPREKDIDYKLLAQEFEISGGYIKNAVLRAAFIASEEGWVINMRLLRHAAALELEDMGRLVARAGSKNVSVTVFEEAALT